jgi:Zn/Cd-binding protein ZinT
MNKRAKATEKSAEAADEGPIEEEKNPYIGKTILVYTKAKRGRKFNWLSATVELKNRNGSYLVKYSDAIVDA